jgi:putative ABC transport system permease protein
MEPRTVSSPRVVDPLPGGFLRLTIPPTGLTGYEVTLMNIGPILRAMKHNRTRVLLIVVEIAVSLAIVTNCVNVILAERGRMAVRSGFDDANIVWLRARPFTPDFQEAPFIRTTIDADLRAIESVPGVRAVSNTSFQLWEGGGSSSDVRPVGDPRPGLRTQAYYASAGIAETLGLTISEGRGFQPEEHGSGPEADTANVMIISRPLAEVLFPDGNAVGQSLEWVNASGEPAGEPQLVIGIMERFYNPFGMPGGELQPVEERGLFYPARAGSYSLGIRYLIRTEPGEMSTVLAAVEDRLVEVHSGRVIDFQTTTEKKSRWFSTSSLMVTTMSFIIVALVTITALGLIGLTALSVAERTRQIGTRRALGATRSAILRHFVIENAIITSAGLLLGIIATYALNFLLVTRLIDLKMPLEIVVFGIVLLLLNAILATLPPAFRAMRISPAIATRSI